MVFADSSSIQGSEESNQAKPIKKAVTPNIKKGINVRLCNIFGFIVRCLYQNLNQIQIETYQEASQNSYIFLVPGESLDH